jgi:hypothetical protein
MKLDKDKKFGLHLEESLQQAFQVAMVELQ